METQKKVGLSNILKIVLLILAAVNFSAVVVLMFLMVANDAFSTTQILLIILMGVVFALPVVVLFIKQVRRKTWVLRTLLIIGIVMSAFFIFLFIAGVISVVEDYRVFKYSIPLSPRFNSYSPDYDIRVYIYEKEILRWSIRVFAWSIVMCSEIVMLAGHSGKKFRGSITVLAGVGTLLAVFVLYLYYEISEWDSRYISFEIEIPLYVEIIFLSYILSCLFMNVWLSMKCREEAESVVCTTDNDTIVMHQCIVNNKTCTKCGQLLAEDAMFCGVCGTKYDEE